MSWSPAHDAVETGDLVALRDLLDAGADIEDPLPDGMTLLLHAIEAEVQNSARTGLPPRGDTTAFLIARGAGTKDALPAASARGHWLAVELIEARQQGTWFGVRCLFKGAASYEERTTLWRAPDASTAVRLAEHEALEYAKLLDEGQYAGVAQAYELMDLPGHGAEVFSLIRDSNLPTPDYLSRYWPARD
jgi:hypothetical protein